MCPSVICQRLIISILLILINGMLSFVYAEEIKTTPTCTLKVVGNTLADTNIKRLGNNLKVELSLQGFDERAKYDFYMAIESPSISGLWFLTTSQPDKDGSFTLSPVPYLKNIAVAQIQGQVLDMVLSPEMGVGLVGQYTFYAVLVSPGANVLDASKWTCELSKNQVFITR